jgi:TonB-linked SusC/RagA family outer membrane protein
MKNLLRTIIGLLFAGLLLLSSGAFAQDKVLIRGTVKSKVDNMTIPGVAVAEVDKDGRVITGTITDINGNYVIRVTNTANKLLFKSVGLSDQKVDIGDQKTINVSMNENVTELDEVVVKAQQQRNIGNFLMDEKDLPFTVQSISTKDLEGVQGASIDDQLQGRLAGVDIVATSGDPGAGMSIRIRGANLLNASSNPLVVIDNVPQDYTFSSDFDFGSADEERYAQMLNIAPEDIKDISVLVDAASTALWGSRGANGVISITTKRGTKSKPRIRYRFDYSTEIQPEPIPMLNGDQYSTLIAEGYMNTKGIPLNTVSIREFQYDPNDPYMYYNYSNNTDWIKEVTQFGYTQQHAINLSGGGDKAKYYTSVTYYDQTGTTIGNSYNRLTTTMNIDYDVSDKIRFSTDFRYTHGFKYSNYTTNLRDIAFTKMPNMSVYEWNEQGEQTENYFSPESNIQGTFKSASSGTYNPVAMANLAYNKQRSDNVTPSFNLRYLILKSLTFQGQLSFSVNNEKVNKFLPQQATGLPLTSEYANRAEDYDNDAFSIYTNNTLNFNPDLGKDHKVTVSVNAQLSSNKGNGFSALVANTPSSSLQDPVVSADISASGLGVNSSAYKNRSAALSGTLFYTMFDRYIFWASAKTEGNSRYARKFRFGFFPSLSFKWRISGEPFMQWSNKILPELQVRLSWGRSGTPPNVSSYQNSYSSFAYSYLGETGVYPSSPELTNLRWTTKQEYNLGIDFGIWDNKVQGSVNMYRFSYTDQLSSGGLPSSTGYASIQQNNTNSDFQGWDLTVTKLEIYKSKKFFVDFRFTFNHTYDVLRKLPENATLEEGVMSENGNYQTYKMIDYPVGGFYGYKYKGVYSDLESTIALDANNAKIYDAKGEPVYMRFNYPQTDYVFQPGDAKYEDVNHDGNINKLDIKYLGSFSPKFFGGFGPSFRYSDLSLSFYFSYRYGNKIVNRARMNAEKMYNYDNQSTATLRRWKYEGDNRPDMLPRALLSAGYNWLGSDRFVEDGSFLRLKTITLRYQLPKKIYQRLKLSDLTLNFTASNLYVWTKYSGGDPEVEKYDDARTPRSYGYNFGVSIGF